MLIPARLAEVCKFAFPQIQVGAGQKDLVVGRRRHTDACAPRLTDHQLIFIRTACKVRVQCPARKRQISKLLVALIIPARNIAAAGHAVARANHIAVFQHAVLIGVAGNAHRGIPVVEGNHPAGIRAARRVCFQAVNGRNIACRFFQRCEIFINGVSLALDRVHDHAQRRRVLLERNGHVDARTGPLGRIIHPEVSVSAFCRVVFHDHAHAAKPCVLQRNARGLLRRAFRLGLRLRFGLVFGFALVCIASCRSGTAYRWSSTAYRRGCIASRRGCIAYCRGCIAYRRDCIAYRRDCIAYRRSGIAYRRGCIASCRSSIASCRSSIASCRSSIASRRGCIAVFRRAVILVLLRRIDERQCPLRVRRAQTKHIASRKREAERIYAPAVGLLAAQRLAVKLCRVAERRAVQACAGAECQRLRVCLKRTVFQRAVKTRLDRDQPLPRAVCIHRQHIHRQHADEHNQRQKQTDDPFFHGGFLLFFI